MKEIIIDIIYCFIGLVIIVFLGLVVWFYPLIDRVTDPCKYYPHTFKDCLRDN